MSSTFLTLRYVAFALFILFNSVICVVAALNLGSLVTGTEKFPEVDAYLIFTGALTIVFVFPVIFIELFRKNAFISRVAIEITWVSIFWVMALSGAAAMTAITPELDCFPHGGQLHATCVSTQILLAFTWLSTVILLTYLLTLIVCAVYHSQGDNHVWQTGVRDFKWFSKLNTAQNPPEAAFMYGKIVDPREPVHPPPIYSQQIGLSRAYEVEPLRIHPTVITNPQPAVELSQPPADNLQSFKFPAKPALALQLDIQSTEPYRTIAPANATTSQPPMATTSQPPMATTSQPPMATTSQPPISLYPQFVQATSGTVVQPPKYNGPTPPPAGSWPRSNPQEPIRRKSRGARDLPVRSEGPSSSDPSGPSSVPRQPSRPVQVSTTRPRPAGPRGASIDQLRALPHELVDPNASSPP